MENLLRKQSQLRKLVIETMGYWRSPLAIYIAIRGLRDTLVELKLTIVLIEGSERRGIGMGAGAGYGGDGTVLDLSEFTVLRKLEVCDHLLFAGPQDESMHMPKWSSYHTLDKGLARRLPASLEFLTVSLFTFLSEVR